MNSIKLLLIPFLILFSSCAIQGDYIKIGDSKINIIKVAESKEDMYQGLSNIESICANCGMLFHYEDKAQRAYVMRNMLFPLDMIWIADGVVVDIHENLETEGERTTNVYKPKELMDEVLEVNAGFVKQNKIEIGDKLVYRIKQFDEN